MSYFFPLGKHQEASSFHSDHYDFFENDPLEIFI